MGLFVKPNISNSASKVGIRFGLFDTDFEYKSFEALGEKVLVKGDKYSYLLDEEKLIESLNANSIGEMSTILVMFNGEMEKDGIPHIFLRTLTSSLKVALRK